MRAFAEVIVLAEYNNGRKYVCLETDHLCKFWLESKEVYYDTPDHNIIRLHPGRVKVA